VIAGGNARAFTDVISQESASVVSFPQKSAVKMAFTNVALLLLGLVLVSCEDQNITETNNGLNEPDFPTRKIRLTMVILSFATALVIRSIINDISDLIDDRSIIDYYKQYQLFIVYSL